MVAVCMFWCALFVPFPPAPFAVPPHSKRVWKPALQEHAASTGEGGAAKNAPAGGEAAAEDDVLSRETWVIC